MKMIADKKFSANWTIASLPVKALVCVALLMSASVFGATTLTWTGADPNSPNELGAATNWSGDVLPSASAGDVGQWDGSVAGDLSLTYSGGLAGGFGNPGVNFALAAGQTGNVSIDSSAGSSLRVNNFTNNSGSAAFTIGGPSGSLQLILGGSPSTQTWINNSSAAATIGQDVQFNMGGGGAHGFALGGTGDWVINTYLGNLNTSGSLNIVKNNAGSLILNPTGGSFGAGPVGTTTVNAGTLQVQTADALQGGSTPSYSIDGFQYGNITVNTNGILDLNGQNLPVNALNGSQGTIESSSGAATLTVGANGDNGNNFSGTITNGAGSVSLVVAGTNMLTLSGTNTYTGGTTVNAGSLAVNGQIAGNVTVASGASFGGTGTIPGTVDWSASGSTLTLVANQPLNLTGSATLNNNGVVVYVPGVSPLAAGTYPLMTYTPANVTGSLNATPVAFTGAGVVAGTYSISMSGGTVTLTVASAVTSGAWTNSVSGNWSTGANWNSNPNVPHSATDTAVLGAGAGFTTVTLDAPETVGSLSFTNANSFAIANAGNTLTLDNAGAGASVNVSAGSSNSISAPVLLNDNATITITPFLNNLLSLSNVVGGAGKTLTMASGGTLGLYGNNTYGPSAGTVGTTLSGGTLLLGNSHALGSGDVSISGGNGTIQFSTPMTLGNNIQVTGGRTLNLNDSGNAVTLSGAITGGGSISYNANGTVTLANVGTMNAVGANGGSGRLILNAVNGSTFTNLYTTGTTHPTLEIASGNITWHNNNVGAAATIVDNGATVTIDSGVIITADQGNAITIGNTSGSTSPATLNVNGTLIDNTATFLVARNGTGVLNLNSGGLIHMVNTGKQFDVTQNAGVGTVNMDGGTLLTGAIGNGGPTASTAIWNWNGGTLKATNTTASAFWNNYSWMTVYVRNGGGIIDNNGVNITNKQPYLHSTNALDNAIDGGITYKGSGITTLFGETNTYTGPTIIAAGTLAMTNAAENPVSTISISNGAVLNLINPTTNVIGGLILGGVSQPAGIYNQDNASLYITGAGGLQVVQAGPIAPTNSPTITQISLSNVGPSGGNVIINGTNGNIGATYYLLASTNIAAPLPQWKTVATNVAAGNSFSFTETNAVTAGAAQQFYILSSTNYNP
ncbi:MAG TPA: autotransporter-associated beta strand repeat-containing protein [Verrucomicrobiae bacterium]|nr:autotransporter-associated beta strand repeat-containing protein [Verrucomicrobiae bacterium]